MNQSNSTTINPTMGDEVIIDLRALFFKLISFWWLFVISLSLCVCSAYLYLRYTTYEYQAATKLILKKGNADALSEEKVLLQEKGLFSGARVMTDEIEILKSKDLIQKVIDDLDFEIFYYEIGHVKESELYAYNCPIRLDSFADINLKSPISIWVEVTSSTTFKYAFAEEESRNSGIFGVPITHPDGNFTIILRDSTRLNWVLKQKFRIEIMGVARVARIYQNKLNVNQVGDKWSSGVVQLVIQDPVPEKARDFLYALIRNYNKAEIQDKNQILTNSLKFIDERLLSLERELERLESGIEVYKEKNQIMTNIAGENSALIIQELNAFEKELADLEVKEEIVELIKKILVDQENEFSIIPVNLLNEYPELSGLINRFNQLCIERSRMINMGTTKQNPMVINLNDQLQDLQSAILQTTDNIKRDIAIPIQKAKQQIGNVRNQIQSVPKKERQLLDQQRRQALKESLYVYLLQRREETALSEAVTTPNTRVIESASSSTRPVRPRPRIIYVLAVLLGVMLPFAYVFIRQLFNDKIETEEQIKRITSIPIIGRIGHSKLKDKVVVNMASRSAVNEMFRSLRTNLNYLNPGHENRVILVTSSVGGEGKTFISINLAKTLSITGKKVLLIGLDLRKPKLSKYMDLEGDILGVTDYLIEDVHWKDLIHAYEEGLDFIISGPIPPNPAELLLNPKLHQLIEQVKSQYDYVIIDTPPVGLVSDAILLGPYANQTIVVVRHLYTQGKMLERQEELAVEQKLVKPGIVFNGIKTNKAYGYSYGYGNSYGYFNNE